MRLILSGIGLLFLSGLAILGLSFIIYSLSPGESDPWEDEY